MTLFLICAILVGGITECWAYEPEDTVVAHLEQISAAEETLVFSTADQYFSRAFHRAFKADIERMNYYYSARLDQLKYGFEVIDSDQLADTGRNTARVTVDFGPRNLNQPLLITERMYYYLIWEHVGRNDPLSDEDGWGWRIELSDALRYDTLADARRLLFLYTNASWNDMECKELISRQGLYRILLGLDAYFLAQQHYPDQLLGMDNRRDVLIAGDYLEFYPHNGFDERPMSSVQFSEKSAGDFSYLPRDDNRDGINEGFWLLLHGKLKDNFYFEDRDTILILQTGGVGTQPQLASAFGEWWQGENRQTLATTDALDFSEALEIIAAYPAADSGLASVTDPQNEVTGDTAELALGNGTASSMAYQVASALEAISFLPQIDLEPNSQIHEDAVPTIEPEFDPAKTAASVLNQAASLAPTLIGLAPLELTGDGSLYPDPTNELVVYSYGW